jgi:hypothetical protein
MNYEIFRVWKGLETLYLLFELAGLYGFSIMLAWIQGCII